MQSFQSPKLCSMCLNYLKPGWRKQLKSHIFNVSLQRATSHTHTHASTHARKNVHVSSDLCSDRFTFLLCFHKCSSSLITQSFDTDRANIANLGLSCMSLNQCDTKILACLKIKEQLRFMSDILCSTVWRDSWMSDTIRFRLLFSGDKISTTSLRLFFNKLPFLVWLFSNVPSRPVDTMQALRSLNAS